MLNDKDIVELLNHREIIHSRLNAIAKKFKHTMGNTSYDRIFHYLELQKPEEAFNILFYHLQWDANTRIEEILHTLFQQ